MKKTSKALAFLLSFILLVSFGVMNVFAASYDAQGTGGNMLKMLSLMDITDNTMDADAYYSNTITTQLDPAAEIVFVFTMTSGMNNFSEALFIETNLPQIGIYDSYGGQKLADPTYISGGSSGISIAISADTLTDGTYYLVFGKDIQGNKASKTLGMDIVFEFTATTGAQPLASPFTDVPDWASDYVDAVVMNGCMSGVDVTHFGSDMALTRGEFVKILGMARGIKADKYETSAFSDVSDTDACSPYAAWAASKNIVNGYGDGMFGRDDVLTREQVVTILYRYAMAFSMDTTASGDLGAFSDSNQISSWASTAMTWAVGADYIIGNANDMLMPLGEITRIQAAKLIAVTILL